MLSLCLEACCSDDADVRTARQARRLVHDHLDIRLILPVRSCVLPFSRPDSSGCDVLQSHAFEKESTTQEMATIHQM
jgi:hypothetical protein